MKYLVSSITVLTLALLISWPAQARNTQLMLPIADAMASKDAKEKLAGSVHYFFSSERSPAILKNFGTTVYSPKTNAAMKSDVNACNWAFLSAMVGLKKNAEKKGANVVVNIMSYYNKQTVSNPKMFECRAGALMAGVTLKGELVKVAR